MNRASRLTLLSRMVVVLGVAIVLVLGAYLVQLRRQAVPTEEDDWRPQPGGSLVICGGGRIPDEIRERFVQLAGGAKARLVIIPAYDPSPDEKARLLAFWNAERVSSAVIVNAVDRAECDSRELAEPLAVATGVWIGGGDQSRLANLYVDTKVERELKALLERGGVIGGASAGAAAMTRVMIAGGIDPVLEQRGFDLLSGAVVDQHFFQRNRTQRLLGVLANHPGLLGVGIDEQTAVVVRKNGTHWSVIGESYAMICLPTDERFPRLEILKPGDSTDIDTLRVQPGATAISSADFWD
jgi:cyanophycinase